MGRPQAAKPPAAAAEDDERQLVSFKVSEEEFAVDIMQVQEIVRLAKVTKVPHAPTSSRGWSTFVETCCRSSICGNAST